jgi:CRISPR-associated endonuclease Csn1
MKKILGLDLGVSSIGFALVEESAEGAKKILDLGVRIVPLSPDDKTEFEQGNAITKNQKRSVKKTIRRGLDRYQIRRAALIKLLKEKGMMPSKAEILEITPLQLWESRARAVHEKVSLTELGRIWLHLNQRRGYQSLGKDEETSKELGDYLKEVTGRHQTILREGITIGQFFARNLRADMHYRIREQVFPRAAYKEEFDAIWKTQSQHYPDLLTDGFKKKVKDEIIYYQRNLKSKKDQVGFCDFEIASRLTHEGKTILAGPRVAPRSSPLFQACKIWESINTLEIRNKRNYAETFQPSIEQKQAILKVLDNEGLIKQQKLFEILRITRLQGYYTQQNATQKGIQGNLTKAAFIKILGENHPALQFDLKLSPWVDTETGEELPDTLMDAEFQNQP